MKDKILFVTRGGEDCTEGFSYVLELARTLRFGIEIIVMQPSDIAGSFEDLMAAAAYAEAGDPETATGLLNTKKKELIANAEEKFKNLISPSAGIETELTVAADGDLTATLKGYLKNRPYIDMVLLSPSLSGRTRRIDLRKLIQTVSKPIVNISRPAEAKI